MAALSVAPLLLAEKAKVTVCPTTGLPCASRAIAYRLELASALTVVGLASRPSVVGLPATKSTVTVLEKPPALATMVAVPRLLELESVTCAMPLAFVRADAAESVPAVVVKLTEMPTAGAPVVLVTVARTAVSAPPVGSVADPVMSVRPLTTVVVALTITLTETVLLLLVVARMVSVPVLTPAV